jgi:two-component system response regulator RegX3
VRNDQTKRCILVVEDEASIREGLCDVLAYHGYEPRAVETGEAGLEAGRAADVELVVLDVMLPGIDGFEVCRRLRQERPQLPVLMLTAKGSEDDLVRGLRSGADDYVTKPFSVRELVARVEALLRRGDTARIETFPFGPWTVDVDGLRAIDGERSVSLSRREVEVLALLARERGRVVSRRTLLQEVWGWHNVDEIETRTVDVHLSKLRRKIQGDGDRWIETVRGAGYRANV